MVTDVHSLSLTSVHTASNWLSWNTAISLLTPGARAFFFIILEIILGEAKNSHISKPGLFPDIIAVKNHAVEYLMICKHFHKNS